MTSAVADAGPLIHLHEVAHLELLSVFDQVMIPGAVWEETVGRGRVGASVLNVLAATTRQNLAQIDLQQRRWGSGRLARWGL